MFPGNIISLPLLMNLMCKTHFVKDAIVEAIEVLVNFLLQNIIECLDLEWQHVSEIIIRHFYVKLGR